jgi:Fic family protein
MAERGAGAGLSGAADGRRPRGEGAGQRAPREWGAISERQYRGLRHAQERGSIARREYAALTGVSERTALNDLSALVRKGLLEATGGRGWRAAYRVRDAAR